MATTTKFYRQPSKKLTFTDAVDIWRRLHKREYQNRIAADYDVNPGRISEIKTGQAHPGSCEVAKTKHEGGKHV